MTELFFKLADLSIDAGWLVLTVIAARFLLKKAPKSLHCCLWILVAVRLVCPFSWESVFSLMPERPEVPKGVQFAVSHAQPGQIVYSRSEPVQEDAGEQPRSVSYVAVPTFEGETRALKVSHPDVMGVVLGHAGWIWLGGMTLMCAYAAVSYLRIRKRIRVSLELSPGVLLCDYIDTPFILGILRPKICLPSEMNPADAAQVLAHEKAHLKRRDHWWKPLGYLLLSIYWFHPLLWLAYILLCRDIELACDERVVKTMEETDRRAYSEALLKCSVPRHLILACPLAFGEVGVKQRIRAVLHYRKPGFWIILVSLMVTAVISVCFLTDPDRDTLSDLCENNRTDAAQISLWGRYGFTHLRSPKELDDVWDALDSITYDPEPHMTETEWEPNNLRLWPWYELRFETEEETLQTIYIYRDYSAICIEADDTLQHYHVNDSDLLEALFTRHLTYGYRHEPSAEPFATWDEPLNWMHNLTPDAFSSIRFREYSSHSINGNPISTFRFQELLEILKDIPAEALSDPVTLNSTPNGDLFHNFLRDNVNANLIFTDQANDLTVLIRYQEESGPKLELYMVNGTKYESFSYKVKSANMWTIHSQELTQYLLDLLEYTPGIHLSRGYWLEFEDEFFSVTNGEGTIDVRRTDKWVYEIVEPGDADSFGIRCRPKEVKEGWIYFSLWPDGFEVDEVNRYYAAYSNGYTSYPLTVHNPNGMSFSETIWSYRRCFTSLGDYVILNEGADDWLLAYQDDLEAIEMYSGFSGGDYLDTEIPVPKLEPIAYTQCDKSDLNLLNTATFETPDKATMTLDFVWKSTNVPNSQDNSHILFAFWPEYETEGMVLVEYWEGFFQPEESLLIEETKVYYYSGWYDGFIGTYPGDERWTYLWINREYGSYVFRCENTDHWDTPKMDCVLHEIGEIKFHK
ncbi:MAG: M56 family metallopeptidase [Oscillospiraceae bacterium]|nr:M56 family metallopeptidase [Oscillospiraceae bacterium]